MRTRYRRFSPGRILLFILLGVVAVFVFGNIVMWLWNYALAPAINIRTVTFWQALGILILSKILFSSFGGGRRPRRNWRERMRDKWSNMSPEEREKFKGQYENWCRPGQTPSDTQ